MVRSSGVTTLRTALLIVLAFSLVAYSLPWTFNSARASGLSRIYFATPTVCCTLPGPSAGVSFRVMMDLATGERINGYNVRIDYSNQNLTLARVLEAQRLDNAGNVFAGQGATLLAYCVDGEAKIAGGCAVGPDADSTSAGQVHYAEVSQAILNGPVSNVTLFTIFFSVNGTGSSV